GASGCQPAQFHVTGGLGTYAANAVISGAPGGVTATWSCALSASNYNCSSSNVGGSGSSALTVAATDVANTSTPAATTATDPASQASPAAILVHGQMAFTPPASVNDAVVGRTYGVGSCPGGSCTGLTYTITGGLGNYGTGSLTASSDTFSCSFTLPNYSCTKNTPISSVAGSYTLTMSTTETGNASTPSSTATDTNRALAVDPVLSISETQTSTWEPAVQNRSYGNNGTPNQVAAAGGIPPYTYTPSGFPASIVCTPLSTSTPTTCSSSSVTDTPMAYTVSVQAIDTGNGSTPAASAAVSTGSDSLTIDSPLAFNPVSALPNALENYPYPTNSGTTVVSETGGLGGNTWIDPNNAAVGACAVPSGASPLGLSVVNSSATTATITGTPAISSPGTYTFQICVTDTANTMTHAGSINSSNISLDVVPSYAAIAEKGADEIEFFDTSAKVDSIVVTQPILTGSGSAPYSAAFSPSGRYAYVTFSGAGKDELAIYDTITNAAATGSPVALTSGCLPHGVAANASYIFIACSGIDDVDVVNAATLAVTALSTGATGGGAEGVAISQDGTRVYVTLSSLNQLFVIANADSSPAALSGSGITNPSPLSTAFGTIPMGIAVAGPNAGTVAYIAKQGASSTVPDGVEVVDVTSNSFPDVASAGFTTSADSSAKPTSVAVTPDSHRIYITLNGLDEFAVVDNTASPPAQLSGSPFTLSGTGTASEGVTIPPASPYQAFIAEKGTNKLGVINDSATAPAEATPNSPYALSGTVPFGIASTPAPQ
ncbi:MAG TPA: hypothetical protein VJS43_01285, partial [Candidatus Acidoferrales bacterium]|nr:hypothetical protein [Candidatus Acidoferrales bacterium]